MKFEKDAVPVEVPIKPESITLPDTESIDITALMNLPES
jgi:hypothetical protein